MVSVTRSACLAPDAAAPLAVPPISLAGRSRTAAAASSPAGVRCHSFCATSTPCSLWRRAVPPAWTRPSTARSSNPPRAVWSDAVPGHVSCRTCAAVAVFTTPSAPSTRSRVSPVDPYGRPFVPATHPIPAPLSARPPAGTRPPRRRREQTLPRHRAGPGRPREPSELDDSPFSLIRRDERVVEAAQPPSKAC